MADCRGSFNVATPVITSALTGDDSPSLFRGFTGSSSTRESPREADTGSRGGPLLRFGARMSRGVKSADLRARLYAAADISSFLFIFFFICASASPVSSLYHFHLMLLLR